MCVCVCIYLLYEHYSLFSSAELLHLFDDDLLNLWDGSLEIFLSDSPVLTLPMVSSRRVISWPKKKKKKKRATKYSLVRSLAL